MDKKRMKARVWKEKYEQLIAKQNEERVKSRYSNAGIKPG